MTKDSREFHRCALEKMKTFTPARTPDGRPDMSGMWLDTTVVENLEKTTVIVDPPDGRIPYRPSMAAQREKAVAQFVSPTGMCFPVGAPRYMYSPTGVGGHRIIQQPNYVVFSMERLHHYRIVPLDGRPRLSQRVKLWMGDSRGRWEGNTLVIETANLNDLSWFEHHGTFMSDEARLEERLTFIDANTLHYQETVIDPRVFTRPWTIVQPLFRWNATGIAAHDLEDDTVEHCDIGLPHLFSLGFKPYPGLHAVAPK